MSDPADTVIGWRALLDTEPDPVAWERICSELEGADESDLAAAALALRGWPQWLRRMPDRWWAQRQAGEHRPWHRLVTHRLLCWNGPEPECAVFTLAGPDNLRVLLLGIGPEGNNHLGSTELVMPVTRTDGVDPGGSPEDDELPAFVAVLEAEGVADDLLFSSDGSWFAVTFGPNSRGSDELQVYGGDGRHRRTVTGGPAADRVEQPLRIGGGCRGRLATAGGNAQAVTVVEVDSGRVLMTAGPAGCPVAMDATGRLVAYADDTARVHVHDVDLGRELVTCHTGLARVNALAFAPDGTAVLAAGAPLAADTGGLVTCRLSLPDGRPTGRVVAPDVAPDPSSPYALWSTRISWTEQRAWVFATDEDQAVLMDGVTGEICYTWEPGLFSGSFTPDGRTLLAAGQDGTVEAWFLHGFA